MMSSTERLAYMADHIARNFASRGPEAAITATADHLATFWDPRSKALAFGLLDGPRPAFMTDAAEAFEAAIESFPLAIAQALH